jgi:hypothetical protein
LEPSYGLGRFPAERQRPDELLLAEVLRNLHAELRAIDPGIEVGWLALVGPPGLDVVLRPERHMDFLDVVAIDVSEVHLERAIVVLGPALEDRLDTLSGAVSELIPDEVVTLGRCGLQSARETNHHTCREKP